MNNLTFRSSKIIYYGPHECKNCGVLIAKMGHEFGGNAFTYPDGPIYPNTEWHPHVCDPKRVSSRPKNDTPHVTPTVNNIHVSALDAKTLCDWVKNNPQHAGAAILSGMEA